MSERELPVRASWENLRKQAKALHRAFHDGDIAAVDRIRHSLPKADALCDQDLRVLDLSLQEAQHVLAKEYGYPTWEALRTAAEVSFDAFADLGREPFHEVLRQVDQKDVSRALSATTEPAREAFYACMSRRVVRFFQEEIEMLAPFAATEVEAAQRRILDTAARFGAERGFDWPPAPRSGGFDDLARLTDEEAKVLLRRLDPLDVARALIDAGASVRGRLLSVVSERAGASITGTGQGLSGRLPAREPAASRRRLVEEAERLGQDGKIVWPPVAARLPWSPGPG